MSTHEIEVSTPIRGAVVLVTGAARGMGALYAQRALDEGARGIALWDVDRDEVEACAARLDPSGTRVLAVHVDVSTPEGIDAGVQATLERFGDVDVLINNAGIVRSGLFWRHDPARDIEATIRINTLAPMWLTRALLPRMIADSARPKRVLNIASAAATLSNPNMSVYAASKAAMLGWSDTVRLELEREGHAHVAVTTFCPSYVSTGMFAGARGPLLTPILRPSDAVDAAWSGMRRGVPLVLRPWTVKLGMAVRGVLPTRAWDLVADRVFKVYSSMDQFTGRDASSRTR